MLHIRHLEQFFFASENMFEIVQQCFLSLGIISEFPLQMCEYALKKVLQPNEGFDGFEVF